MSDEINQYLDKDDDDRKAVFFERKNKVALLIYVLVLTSGCVSFLYSFGNESLASAFGNDEGTAYFAIYLVQNGYLALNLFSASIIALAFMVFFVGSPLQDFKINNMLVIKIVSFVAFAGIYLFMTYAMLASGTPYDDVVY